MKNSNTTTPNVLAAALLALLGLSLSTIGQAADNKANMNAWVAKVNGKKITQGDVYRYRDFLRESGANAESLDPNKLAISMIHEEALLQEGSKKGFGKSKGFRYEMQINRKKTIISHLLKDYLKKNEPTSAEIDSAYREYAKDKKEYDIRHILIDDPAIAEDVTKKLRKGASFTKLAKEHSQDSSAANGGRLGWVTPSIFVPEFKEAILKLRVNATTKKPVKSSFGWHIIQNLGVRNREIKSFDDIKPTLINQISQKKISEYSSYLVKKAKIDLPKEPKKK